MSTSGMRPRTPIQQAIQVVIGSPQTGRVLKGILYANDFGDGATSHYLEGYLSDPQGLRGKVSGHLSGIQFVPRKTRGAPKKTGRNVALFLAYQWFIFLAVSRGESRVPTSVVQEVMGLWEQAGFKGATEETHLRKLIKAGAEEINGYRILRQDTTADGTARGVMVAAPEDTVSLLPDGHIRLNGPGWMWCYGEEMAAYGQLSGGTSAA